MENRRSFNTYETRKNYSLNEFWLGVAIWGVLGLIVGLWLGSILEISYLPRIFFGVLIGAVLGYTIDTKPVQANQIASLYRTIGQKPEFSVTGTDVWLQFGLRKIGRIYDYSDGTSTIMIEKAPTGDKDPRQFISAKFDVPDYISDPLAYENNAGNSDAEELLQKFQSNQFQAWARSQTLYELENESDVKVEGDFLTNIIAHAKKYGVKIIGDIEVRDITSTSDEDREALGKQFYKEQQEDLKQENFNKRVNYKYLSSLARRIKGKSNMDYITAAKAALSDPSDYEVSVEAVKLAEIDFPNIKERSRLYKEAYRDEEVRQGLVPVKRFEGLENSKILFDPNK